MKRLSLAVLALAAAPALGGLAPSPPVATVSGADGAAPVQLVFDRRGGSVSGSLGPARVSLRADAGAMRGEAGGGRVDLAYDSTPERVTLSGSAAGRPLELTLDWGARTLTGYAAGGPVNVQFDLKEGTVSGAAGRAPVDLRHDAASGRLTGALGRRPVDLTLTGMDLADFLQYLFLFL